MRHRAVRLALLLAVFIAVPLLLVGATTFNRLRLAAGGTTANSAPLYLTTQASPLATPEQGAMELVGNSLQFSQLVRRRGVAMSQGVITSSTTLVATDQNETAALITASHGANYLEVGKMEEILLYGTISQRTNANARLTVRIKYAGVTKQTIVTPALTAITTQPFLIRVACTVRSTGGSGTMQINGLMEINGVAVDPGASTLANIDTTTAQNTTVTFQWDTDNNASNIVTLEQGRVLCVETNR